MNTKTKFVLSVGGIIIIGLVATIIVLSLDRKPPVCPLPSPSPPCPFVVAPPPPPTAPGCWIDLKGKQCMQPRKAGPLRPLVNGRWYRDTYMDINDIHNPCTKKTVTSNTEDACIARAATAFNGGPAPNGYCINLEKSFRPDMLWNGPVIPPP